MKTYLYKGAQPYNADLNITKDGKIEQLHVRLSHSDSAVLPADHDAVVSMVKAGLLVEVNQPKTKNNSKK